MASSNEISIVAELNIIGALLLENNNYNLALLAFQEAVRAFMYSLSADSLHQCSIEAINESKRVKQVAETLRGNVDMPQLSNNHSRANSSNNDFTYKASLHTIEERINILLNNVARNQVTAYAVPSQVQLPTTVQDATATHWSSKEEISSSIIYNMALTKHMQGINTENSMCLEQAFHLYGLALTTISPPVWNAFMAKDEEYCCKFKLQVLHYLALLNNMVDVCCQLGRHCALAEYFDLISKVAKWYSNLESFEAFVKSCSFGAAAA